MNYSGYIAMAWVVLTNFGTETLTHAGAINVGILMYALHIQSN
jgi:hypothetical protein